MATYKEQYQDYKRNHHTFGMRAKIGLNSWSASKCLTWIIRGFWATYVYKSQIAYAYAYAYAYIIKLIPFLPSN